MTGLRGAAVALTENAVQEQPNGTLNKRFHLRTAMALPAGFA